MLHEEMPSARNWQTFWTDLLQRSMAPFCCIGVALALVVGHAVLQPLRYPGRWMDYVQDDTFYYLAVARNLATGHGSTFNGIVPTNGYHPLWMLCFAAVIWLRSGLQFVPAFLAFSVWASTLATYVLTYVLFRKNGIPRLVGSSLAVAMAIYFMHVAENCMEVTLVVPLSLALMLFLQRGDGWKLRGSSALKRGICLGLLAAAVVLSRIDTLILVGLLAGGIGFQSALRRKISRDHVFGVCLGFLPVVAYFLSNKWWFHSWLPVSGLAKQLKVDHGFTWRAWHSVSDVAPLQATNLIPIVLALCLLPVVWHRLSLGMRAIAPAVLVYPFVYVTILSWCSDWKLWSWYFYMLRPAMTVAIIVLARLPLGANLLRVRPVQVSIVVLCLLRIGVVRWDAQQPEIVRAALKIRQFALTHPGVYAMGDRSGSVGFLISQPVVQTEGLVMDRNFLKTIALQRPLRDVLADFKVRYYVGSELEPYPGCFQAVEPAQAGPHAPHMQGQFCEAPIATWTIDGVKTLLFDLHPERSIAASAATQALPPHQGAL